MAFLFIDAVIGTNGVPAYRKAIKKIFKIGFFGVDRPRHTSR